MQDNFILYKQAIDLKEFEFNEPCFGRYRKGKFQLNTLGKPHDFNTHEIVNGDVSAPLWQQAFNWFRDENKFNSNINFIIYTDGTPTKYFYEIDSTDENFEKFFSGNFNTYKEAQIELLNKMIAIKKWMNLKI